MTATMTMTIEKRALEPLYEDILDALCAGMVENGPARGELACEISGWIAVIGYDFSADYDLDGDGCWTPCTAVCTAASASVDSVSLQRFAGDGYEDELEVAEGEAEALAGYLNARLDERLADFL